ncbi:hypothetical protein FHX06_003061 [Rhizobium sp. BK512]|jgi:hypothetical protein|uniref:hypothetical protein n=1 Tax=Rhizobium sp. BK512 TaxID=2587010 RepID=UPI001609BC64|nr:hypothetical protein [Rhizobium sp. BK512]MBB3561734.1 hypothetical protein [Rhizobium sp. BK512]
MGTKDTNAKAEQRRPRDVGPIAETADRADRESIAPPTIQPPGARDESERPIVDPITGVAH